LLAWLRDVVNSVIVPHGDWGYGAMYLGVALLLGELLGAGSAR
jgi:putative oxidoreductase